MSDILRIFVRCLKKINQINNMPIGELQEIISNLEDSTPKDKRTVRYRHHILELNNLFIIYNSRVKEKIYKLIR